jgi:hypothetical protein
MWYSCWAGPGGASSLFFCFFFPVFFSEIWIIFYFEICSDFEFEQNFILKKLYFEQNSILNKFLICLKVKHEQILYLNEIRIWTNFDFEQILILNKIRIWTNLRYEQKNSNMFKIQNMNKFRIKISQQNRKNQEEEMPENR